MKHDWFITRALIALLSQGEKMSAQIDKLTRDVAQMQSVAASAVVLITGLAQQIRDAGTDPVALDGLAVTLENSAADLAAAVSANTPAAPKPAPDVGGAPPP